MRLRDGYSRPSFRSSSVTRLARAFKKGDIVKKQFLAVISLSHVSDSIVSTDLCCSEEDFLANVSDGAGGDPQAHPGEDISVVSLTRMESSSVRQGDGVERAPAGEDAPTLRQTSGFVRVSYLYAGTDGERLEEVLLSACSTARQYTQPCWSGY